MFLWGSAVETGRPRVGTVRTEQGSHSGVSLHGQPGQGALQGAGESAAQGMRGVGEAEGDYMMGEYNGFTLGFCMGAVVSAIMALMLLF